MITVTTTMLVAIGIGLVGTGIIAVIVLAAKNRCPNCWRKMRLGHCRWWCPQCTEECCR